MADPAVFPVRSRGNRRSLMREKELQDEASQVSGYARDKYARNGKV
jgi:hypothetical protein